VIEWVSANAWLYNGSISGSLVAMMLARNLSLPGRIQALVIGSLIGIFFGPLVCEIWFHGYDPLKSRIPSAVCFAVGATGMAVMPILIRRSKWFAERFQFRIVSAEKRDE
jgi:hypothetical protein